MQSSLVTEPTKLAIQSRWSPKARRWYQRLLSGITHHQANRRVLRVITLTSASRTLDVNDSWQVLLKRIRRRWRSGFEYWKLRTSEGSGVLHIVYSGPWIPQSWLSRSWKDIHASPVVYIQKLRYRRKRLIGYLMTHYLPAHDDGRLYTRMSWSWGWVFRGFVGAWRWFWKRGPTRYDAINEWNKLMRRSDPLLSYKISRNKLYKQTKLSNIVFYI
ncbi:hypothetical protein ES703_111949 [subsurface metagenome]